MTKKQIFGVVIGLGVIIAGLLGLIMNRRAIATLNPAGPIAQQELTLIGFTVFLMLVIVIPVFAMTFFIAFRYREGNAHRTEYKPDWDHSRLYESIWWGFPLLIIIILSIVTWTTTHQLDPFRPLSSSTKPLTIQVVALQWRWLFIYPEQGIATMNDVQFPEKTPLNFELTADAPMNSFWIPRLGSQMYAMTGMSTQLHLEASGTGTYHGLSANISGRGFANMQFQATSLKKQDFETWVEKIKDSSEVLDPTVYARLARPTDDSHIRTYTVENPDLYDSIVVKYAGPHAGHEATP